MIIVPTVTKERPINMVNPLIRRHGDLLNNLNKNSNSK